MPDLAFDPSTLVATLIANPATKHLTSAMVDKACATVHATGMSVLAENNAMDILLPRGITQLEARTRLENALDGQPIDIIIQPVLGRRKKLLIADMDSTMIEQECIDELADEVGLHDEIAALTAQAMRGEIEFEGALRARVGLLAGLPLDVVDKVIANRITYRAGGKTLIATMRQAGCHTALVSGGFILFTEKIAATLKFHEHHANRLQHDGRALTGKVGEPILGAEAKLHRLRELCNRLNITMKETMAVGDGANDLPMLQQAGSGVALHAKPMVAKSAHMRVDYGDLTALLHIQGYKLQDFVAG